jgi:hypothetical protein
MASLSAFRLVSTGLAHRRIERRGRLLVGEVAMAVAHRIEHSEPFPASRRFDLRRIRRMESRRNGLVKRIPLHTTETIPNVGPKAGSGGRASVANARVNALGTVGRVAGSALVTAGLGTGALEVATSDNPTRSLAVVGGGLLGELWVGKQALPAGRLLALLLEAHQVLLLERSRAASRGRLLEQLPVAKPVECYTTRFIRSSNHAIHSYLRFL